MDWIDAVALKQWADHREAQELLPKLVRLLIHDTAEELQRSDFPAGASVQSGGWDGIVETGIGSGLPAWRPSARRGATSPTRRSRRSARSW